MCKRESDEKRNPINFLISKRIGAESKRRERDRKMNGKRVNTREKDR